jgi:LysR family transcriptional regulator, low CO2-responsive transcriptional regulator
MDLNINHLRSFYTVASQGSVSKAAFGLVTTRSVLMSHVKSLEDFVGVRLIVSEGDSLRLTQTGEAVFKKASKLFREVHETELFLQELSSRKGAELRIGCPESLEDRLLSSFISSFKRIYPDIRVIVNNGKDIAMAKSVEDGRNDLAVFRMKPENCRLETETISEEELVLIAAPASVHVSGGEVAVKDLARVPFISMKEGSAIREAVLAYLRKHSVDPKVAFEATSVALLKEHVRRDNGLAFIEQSMVDAELDECLLKKVRIPEGSPRIATAIGYSHRGELSLPADDFLKLIIQTGGMTRSSRDATADSGVLVARRASSGLAFNKGPEVRDQSKDRYDTGKRTPNRPSRVT